MADRHLDDNSIGYYNRAYEPKTLVTNPTTGQIANTYGAYDVINVKDFGARADGNDQTTNIQNAINQALTERVGTVYIPPEGEFHIGELIIPNQLYDSDGVRTLALVGNGTHCGFYGTVSNIPLSSKGSILKSNASGTGKGIIRVEPATLGGAGDLASNVKLIVRGLHLRAYDNPQCAGIHAGYAQHMVVEDVMIDNAMYSTQGAEPTLNTAVGIITPYINNDAMNYIRNTHVNGFYKGIEFNEHSYADYMNIVACITAVSFPQANASTLFGRLCVSDCQNPIVINGTCRFQIQQLSIEHDGSGWKATPQDVYDISNQAEGEITWATSQEGVGGITSTNFTKTGGKNILCRPIGGVWQWTTAGRPTPARKVMGYNTTDNKVEYHNGTTWIQL